MDLILICPRCGARVQMSSLRRAVNARWCARHPDLSVPGPGSAQELLAEYRRVHADVTGEFDSAGCAALVPEDRSCGGADDTTESVVPWVRGDGRG